MHSQRKMAQNLWPKKKKERWGQRKMNRSDRVALRGSPAPKGIVPCLSLSSLQDPPCCLSRHLVPQRAHRGFSYPRTHPGPQRPPWYRQSSAKVALPATSTSSAFFSPTPEVPSSPRHLLGQDVWRRNILCVFA